MKLETMSKQNINKTLSKLNIKAGDIVFVSSKDLDILHISEKRYFINNLIEYLSTEGTVVMDLSGTNYDPSLLTSKGQLNYNVTLRSLMPGFSKNKAHMYADDPLAKCLLLDSQAIISNNHAHPYIGVGKYAKLICQSQSLDFPNGSMSPLARLYELRAKALLINSKLNQFKLNNYVFETSHKGVISINGGSVIKNNQTIWSKFLEKKVDIEKLKQIIDTNSYKKLFYQDKINKAEVMAVDIRDYIDYCRMYI